MDCLAEIIGLRGGCEDVSVSSEIYLDTKVKYHELEQYVDQNDVANNTASKLFTSLRSQAALEVIDEIDAHMASGYIAKTVVKSAFVGDAGTTLTDSLAAANLKGIRLRQSTSYPSYAFRVGRIGFIGNYTGNVVVLYYDGLTGEQLATDTIAAIANTRVEVNVNRQFRTELLTIVYDATGINGYKTTVNGGHGTCLTCRDGDRINGYCNGQAITATIGTPLDHTVTSDMGGLTVGFSVECDHQSWICRIKQQLGISMLYKTAELAMEYGLTTGRENTNTIRDYESLGERQQMYHEQYSGSISRALKAINLPNEPNCFVCKRKSRIVASIP